MKIVNIEQMQKAELDCSNFGISVDNLMENAGRAVAQEIRNISNDLRRDNIVIAVGPGNNGGDGLVAARYLYTWGADVRVYLCGKRPEGDPNLTLVQQLGISIINASSDSNNNHLTKLLSEATLIIDAVFGTGKSRAISGKYAQVLNMIIEARHTHRDLKIIALDLPSGLNANNGEVDAATPEVDYTVALGFAKVGLFNQPGSEKAGIIKIVDIGIPSKLVDYVKTDLITDQSIKCFLPKRSLVSNKGTYGKVLALVGSLNYIGAAYLSCIGTMRVGAGLTTLAARRSLLPILASKISEITYLPLPEIKNDVDVTNSMELLVQNLPVYDVLLVGCGIGQTLPTVKLMKRLILNSQSNLPPVVLDADGLNILSKSKDWWTKFRGDAILTPHAGEMARLLETNISNVQHNRIEIARDSAVNWNKTLVLKGAYTVIASPEGQVRVSPFANPGLASAGTGDVLAGCIAGMVAQGLPLFDAATCGVYLHSQAAEMVKAEMGEAGMMASDLLPLLPCAIRHLKQI
jgi:hydroxyethylthiazole kinase-like uncharacterized protein yjeF